MNIRWTGKDVIVTDYKNDTIKRYAVSSPEGKYVLSKLLIFLGAMYAGIGLFVLILLNIVFYFTSFSDPEIEPEDMFRILLLSIGIPGMFVVLGIILLAIGLHFKKKYKSSTLVADQTAGGCHSADELNPELVSCRQD